MPNASDRRVSWRSVALLVALGASSGLAFTRPGKWVAYEALAPLRHELDFRLPLRLNYVVGKDSRTIEAMRAFADMNYDGDQPARSRAVPTPDQVAQRLRRIDGWTTAVLVEAGTSAGALYAAGLGDIELCAKVAGPPDGPRPGGWQGSTFPDRAWRIVLLDAQARGVGVAYVSALRGGFRRSATEPDVFEACPSEPGDGELPSVCIFHRTPTGDVVTG